MHRSRVPTKKHSYVAETLLFSAYLTFKFALFIQLKDEYLQLSLLAVPEIVYTENNILPHILAWQYRSIKKEMTL